MTLDQFREIWLLDFEFMAPPGERPTPWCLVAREYRSDKLLRVWLDDATPQPCPIPTGQDVLFVAYYASAELGCFLKLGWPLPSRVLDLYSEFRNLTNGLPTPNGSGLLGALVYFGLDALDAVEKNEMRELAMRGGPYTPEEQLALLDYCQTDVDALARLLPKLGPTINVDHALSRGRYMAAVAHMEWNGVPLDVSKLALLKVHWTAIQERLIEAINADYGVYQGRTFKADRWAAYLAKNEIPWPRLLSGALALDDETFRKMAKLYPKQVGPIRELRHTLGKLHLNELAVGADGRNRCLLSPFRARTSRNQPSNSQFIFGPSAWLRSLIKPEPGRAVAYVDWSQQEFAVAAALSGDAAMKEAYRSGDPYLTFAKQAGAVPPNATKQSHPVERTRFKVCALAVQYGMGEQSLAASLGEPEIVGRELLRLHKQTYPAYWRWSQAAVDHAMLFRRLHTVFGWNLYVGPEANPRSLANFPCQANGAEMLRLACCLIVERGIKLLGPIHDAVLIEGPADCIEAVVAETQAAMCEAGRILLDGFELRTDACVVVYPERYEDERGVLMWQQVNATMTALIDGG
jgi:DNA polymerase-1